MSRPTVSLLTSESPNDWRYLSTHDNEKFYQNSNGEITTETWLFNKSLRKSYEKKEQQKLDDMPKSPETSGLIKAPLLLTERSVVDGDLQHIKKFQLENTNP